MSTPANRNAAVPTTAPSAVPATVPPGSAPATFDRAAYATTTPSPVAGPLGWVLVLAAGIGLMLASWTIYPTDYDGMWAGYRDGLIATVAVIAALALRSSLAGRVSLAVLALCGLLLVLFAVFLDNTHVVFVSELAAGIVLLVGTALQAGGARRVTAR
jgi:hypothetical protein